MSLINAFIKKLSRLWLPARNSIAFRCVRLGQGRTVRQLLRPERPKNSANLVVYDPLFTPFYQGHSYQLLIFFHTLAHAIDHAMAYIGPVELSPRRSKTFLSKYPYIHGSALICGYQILCDSFSLSQTQRVGRTIQQDLEGIFPHNQPNCLCLPNATPWMVHGLLLWIRSLPASKRPRVIIGLLIWDRWIERDSDGEIARQLSKDLRRLDEQTTLEIYVETKHTQQMLKTLCPLVSIHRLPYLAATRAIRSDQRANNQTISSPVCGLMGRFGVASTSNQEVIAAITDHSNAQIRWIIQTDSKTHSSISSQSNVHWLGNNISDHKYYNAFGTLSCVVMVFPSGTYEWDGSGIFYEAVLGRKILILPAGCRLLEELNGIGYPAITYERTQPGSLSRAVQSAISQHDILLRKAQEAPIPAALADSPKRLAELITSADELTTKNPTRPTRPQANL